MRDLSTTLCRGITRQDVATVPWRAHQNGHTVLTGIVVSPYDLDQVAGGPSAS